MGVSKRMISGPGTLIVLVAAWYGYGWWTEGRFIESTDDAYVGGDVTAMAPKVAGIIAQVAVEDNQEVHAGDLLVRLDDRDYRAALAKAEAEVDGERATQANLEASRHLQQARIAEARAGIVSTAAESIRAHDDQIRYRALSSVSAVSLQAFQKADADYKQALAGQQRAQAGLEAAERQLQVIDTQKRQAEAALTAALADRETARLNLGYTELRAPFDGVIGNRSARQGSYAPIGAALVSVVPAKGLWVEANFKESQLAHMRPGEPVTVEADALPGQVFHGHVASLAPATGAQFSLLPAENATGNFTKIVQRVPVRVRLDGAAGDLGLLRPGLSVTVSVDQRGRGGS
ncbi:MAG: HlyD family secretion protein [Telmatospirillum sp.]|nr:HlyD family secretion protein [Telmatospirillum sp.]